MPLEITVGPPQLVVHDGETVWLSEPDGQHDDGDTKGLMFRDTRLISTWNFFANGAGWDLLNGGTITHFAARVFLVNREIEATTGRSRPRRSACSRSLGRRRHARRHRHREQRRRRVQFNLEIAGAQRLRRPVRGQVRQHRPPRPHRPPIGSSASSACARPTQPGLPARASSITAQCGHARRSTPTAGSASRSSWRPAQRWHACLLYDAARQGTR